MMSYCYVILPLQTDLNDISKIVKELIGKYYSEREVSPFKEFYSENYTYDRAEYFGFGGDLASFAKYLERNEQGYGIENGLLYMVSTYNPDSKWDYFIVEECKKGYELKDEPPYSIVTSDGEWFSATDYDYKPILDFENNTKLHSGNINANDKWNLFLNEIFTQYQNNDFVVLMIHS